MDTNIHCSDIPKTLTMKGKIVFYMTRREFKRYLKQLHNMLELISVLLPQSSAYTTYLAAIDSPP